MNTNLLLMLLMGGMMNTGCGCNNCNSCSDCTNGCGQWYGNNDFQRGLIIGTCLCGNGCNNCNNCSNT